MKYTLGKTNNQYDIQHDLNDAGNRHILITGRSGSGKTTALCHIASQLKTLHEDVLFLDLFSDFSKMYSDFGAIDIMSHPAISSTFTRHNVDGNAIENQLRYAYMISNVFQLGNAQHSLILKALSIMEHVAHLENHLNMGNPYASYLNKHKHPDLIMLAYTLHELNSSVSRSLAQRFLDFALLLSQEYHTDLFLTNLNGQQIIRYPDAGIEMNAKLTELFLWDIFNQRKQHPELIETPVNIILDECQHLSWKENGILALLLTEGRKYKINLILATQFLSADMNKKMKACFQQADLQLYFSPAASDIHFISKIISSVDCVKTALDLQTLKVGECLAIGMLSGKNSPSRRQAIKIRIPAIT